MSDTQSDPTPGPWLTHITKQMKSTGVTALQGPEDAPDYEKNVHQVAQVNRDSLLEGDWKANARLIAAAGTAAHELPSDVDPVAAVEALPELLKLVEKFRDSVEALDRNFKSFGSEKEALNDFLNGLSADD